MKVLAVLLSLAVAASARMAYQFSDGYLDILGAEPVQNFDCTGRRYGYYADVATNCQVFHVCLPIQDEAGELAETAHFSFFCGNGTVFDQESLTCAHSDYAFPCEEAETLFELSNADFGRIPEEGFVPEGASIQPIAPVSALARSSPDIRIAPEDTPSVDATPEEAPVADASFAIPASVPLAASSADETAEADVNVAIPASVPVVAEASVNVPAEATLYSEAEEEATEVTSSNEPSEDNVS